MADFDKELDARGLSCPLPILKAKKGIDALAAGQVMRVITTDPGSVKDFESFCTQTGNELISSTSDADTFTFDIRKAG